MIGFLIALVALAVIYIIKENEKLDSKISTRRANTWRDRYIAWTNKVENGELEDELREYISDDNNYEDVWDELAKAYEEMGIEKDFLCFNLKQANKRYGYYRYTISQREKIIKYNCDEAIIILMANRGYVPNRLSGPVFGYSCSGVFPFTKQWYIDSPKLILWVTERLKEHGINEDVFALGWSNDAYLVGSEAFKNSKIKFEMYAWKPQVRDNAKIFR